MPSDRFQFYRVESGGFVLRRAGVELDFDSIEEGLTFVRTVARSDDAEAEVFDAEGRRFLAVPIGPSSGK